MFKERSPSPLPPSTPGKAEPPVCTVSLSLHDLTMLPHVCCVLPGLRSHKPCCCFLKFPDGCSWCASYNYKTTQGLVQPQYWFQFWKLLWDSQVWVCVLATQSCDPTDCSPPDSSVRGILQARILEWVAIPFSRGSSQPRDQAQVFCIADRFFTVWATREAPQIGQPKWVHPEVLTASLTRGWDWQETPCHCRLLPGSSALLFFWVNHWSCRKTNGIWNYITGLV